LKFSRKIKEVFFKIWRDPVWSKVISVGILALIGITYAKITNHSWNEIYDLIITNLSFKIPLFVFLSIIALYFIIKKLIQLFRKRKSSFWNEQIGNYTFKELYNILLTETLPIQTQGMKMSGRPAPTHDLLTLFRIYYSQLNKGFGIYDNLDDGGYLYAVFAPRLVGFGLVDEYQKPDENLPDRTDVAYKTSILGHKFHASLDKIILASKLKELRKKKG
jgi:hypothetical protein